MHFASLILAITAATTASASAVAKRGGFYPTFAYSDAAINAPVGDYLTYTLVSDIFGKVLAPFFWTIFNRISRMFHGVRWGGRLQVRQQ